MIIKGNTFLVLGISKSGYGASNYILNNGGKCYIFDDVKTQKTLENIRELEEKGAKKITESEANEILKLIDALIISPGVPINHKLAVKAKEEGVLVIGEVEFGYEILRPKIAAITGTNGKTTTVSMIGEILNVSNKNNKLVGNIGTPITTVIDEVKRDDNLIFEISSFQLESIRNFKPDIACILNVTPDHLERHYTMDNYIFLKKRLLKNLTSTEFAVLNFDDETVKNFVEKINAKPYFISLKNKVNGGYLSEGKLFVFGEYLMEESELSVKGEHNVYNALFSAVVCKLLGATLEEISKGLKEFKGVKHRLELVKEKDGIKYLNDSKSTNTASTITAVKSMKNPTVLILGGSEKGEKYEDLFNVIKESSVKRSILTGASRFNMLKAASNVEYSDVTLTENFEDAVRIAKVFLSEGDVLLLSPACASFDNFINYEERGEKFIKLVEDGLE